MTEHKKIIIFEGAIPARLEKLHRQISNMKKGDSLLMDKLPKIIDLEDVRLLSKEDVEAWCKVHNWRLEQNDNQ